MLATAVSRELAVWWWSALAVGLVVALVAWGLLHGLFRMVTRIREGLEDVWEAGKQVARNTASTWMLGQTARLSEEVHREAVAHDAALGKGG